MSGAVDLAAYATAILAELVAIDTTSRRSNLALIELVEARLATIGASGKRVGNADGSKANLYATLGPQLSGGVVLSGHTDVVPVDGQAWSSSPFALARRGDRLFGRGTCDMKAFLALALAAAPRFAAPGALKRPVHLAFSYDEEVGCLGAPAMIDEIVRHLPTPAAVVVGEPTMLTPVGAHKGIVVERVTVTGHEAHSSLTHLGVSATETAIRLMAFLMHTADELARTPRSASPFHPPHPTLTIGEIAGGTATNILAGRCSFAFDLRCPADVDPEEVLAPFHAFVEEVARDMQARYPGTGVAIERLSTVPAMALATGDAADALVRALTGDNRPAGAVPYAAEAGQFQRAGLSTVICGPGSIEQAHQPDEYIDVSQIEAGAAFMLRLAEHLSA